MMHQSYHRARYRLTSWDAGAGESGKSTVLKQMRLIYASGFSPAEKGEWRAIIFANILSAFKVIIDAMDDMSLEFENKTNEVSKKPPLQTTRNNTRSNTVNSF